MSFYRIGRKPLAIVLAWLFWWIPIGLHRLVMRQKYWWVHTLLAVTASAASFRFYHHAYNLKLGRGYMETGIVPPLGTYANTWLLVFAALWLIVVLYDLIAVFFFRLPDGRLNHE